MSGGNSHQRAMERANQGRTWKHISRAVADYMGGMQALPPLPPAWHERGLFWGSFGLFASIVLAVLAAVLRDFRWLLIVALLPAGVCWWVACAGIKNRLRRLATFLILCAVTGIGVVAIYVNLKTSDELLEKYPLGYILIKNRKHEAVHLDMDLTDKYDFDWTGVRMFDLSPTYVQMQAPTIKEKNGPPPILGGAIVQAPKTGGYRSWRALEGDQNIRMWVELVDARKKMFLVGFDYKIRKPLSR